MFTGITNMAISTQNITHPMAQFTPRTRVLVVDDHPAIRDALAAVITDSSDLVLCAEAESSEQVFRAVERLSPEVAVVDIALPDAHGLDLIANLLARYPSMRVVVFSVYDERIYAERAIRAGALGYVMKHEPVHEVLEAIRCVARGEVYLSRAMASRIVSKASLRRPSRPSAPTDLLTDREIAVLQLLGEGNSVESIAERLHLSRKTVETHRRNAKEKLGFDSVSELLLFAVRWTDAQNRSGGDLQHPPVTQSPPDSAGSGGMRRLSG